MIDIDTIIQNIEDKINFLEKLKFDDDPKNFLYTPIKAVTITSSTDFKKLECQKFVRCKLSNTLVPLENYKENKEAKDENLGKLKNISEDKKEVGPKIVENFGRKGSLLKNEMKRRNSIAYFDSEIPLSLGEEKTTTMKRKRRNSTRYEVQNSFEVSQRNLVGSTQKNISKNNSRNLTKLDREKLSKIDQSSADVANLVNDSKNSEKSSSKINPKASTTTKPIKEVPPRKPEHQETQPEITVQRSSYPTPINLPTRQSLVSSKFSRSYTEFLSNLNKDMKKFKEQQKRNEPCDNFLGKNAKMFTENLALEKEGNKELCSLHDIPNGEKSFVGTTDKKISKVSDKKSIETKSVSSGDEKLKEIKSTDKIDQKSKRSSNSESSNSSIKIIADSPNKNEASKVHVGFIAVSPPKIPIYNMKFLVRGAKSQPEPSKSIFGKIIKNPHENVPQSEAKTFNKLVMRRMTVDGGWNSRSLLKKNLELSPGGPSPKIQKLDLQKSNLATQQKSDPKKFGIFRNFDEKVTPQIQKLDLQKIIKLSPQKPQNSPIIKLTPQKIQEPSIFKLSPQKSQDPIIVKPQKPQESSTLKSNLQKPQISNKNLSKTRSFDDIELKSRSHFQEPQKLSELQSRIKKIDEIALKANIKPRKTEIPQQYLLKSLSDLKKNIQRRNSIGYGVRIETAKDIKMLKLSQDTLSIRKSVSGIETSGLASKSVNLGSKIANLGNLKEKVQKINNPQNSGKKLEKIENLQTPKNENQKVENLGDAGNKNEESLEKTEVTGRKLCDTDKKSNTKIEDSGDKKNSSANESIILTFEPVAKVEKFKRFYKNSKKFEGTEAATSVSPANKIKIVKSPELKANLILKRKNSAGFGSKICDSGRKSLNNVDKITKFRRSSINKPEKSENQGNKSEKIVLKVVKPNTVVQTSNEKSVSMNKKIDIVTNVAEDSRSKAKDSGNKSMNLNTSKEDFSNKVENNVDKTVDDPNKVEITTSTIDGVNSKIVVAVGESSDVGMQTKVVGNKINDVDSKALDLVRKIQDYSNRIRKQSSNTQGMNKSVENEEKHQKTIQKSQQVGNNFRKIDSNLEEGRKVISKINRTSTKVDKKLENFDRNLGRVDKNVHKIDNDRQDGEMSPQIGNAHKITNNLRPKSSDSQNSQTSSQSSQNSDTSPQNSDPDTPNMTQSPQLSDSQSTSNSEQRLGKRKRQINPKYSESEYMLKNTSREFTNAIRSKKMINKPQKVSTRKQSTKPEDPIAVNLDETSETFEQNDELENIDTEVADSPSTSQTASTSHQPCIRPALKVIKCEVCSKVFSKSYSLARHMQLHSGDRRYACSKCEYRFTQRSDLMRHMLIHEGSPSIPCPKCDKKFRTTKSLQGHLELHEASLPYKCDQCEVRFRSTKNLRYHVMAHHSGIKFQCGYCGNSFTDKKSLKVHVETHEVDEEDLDEEELEDYLDLMEEEEEFSDSDDEPMVIVE